MKKRLQKQDANPIVPMPSFEETVTMMYDKGLDGRLDKIIQVIYNPEHTKRFMILKSERGYYKYAFEELHPFDEEEWALIGNLPGALPAMWEPTGDSSVSLFSGIDEITEAIKASSEYTMHFSEKL